MVRRRFLKSSIYWLLGGLIGLRPLLARARSAPLTCLPDNYIITLIIDDIGFSLRRARMFLELDIPLTYSILPQLTYSRRLAAEIHGLGHEIMLHQPMEPHNPALDPGPGALFVGDSPARIDRIVKENVASVPYARGVNNHMGSKFTCNRSEVRVTLHNFHRRGLFFIDSRTSGRSVAYRTARDLRLSTTCRDIFLDNVRDETAVLLQLIKTRRHAEKYGHAVAIGHPYPETAAAVGRFARALKGSNIHMVYASQNLI